VWLPGILRRMGLRNRVGFFLHIPFPEPDQFRRLPDHREMAESLLSSDVLGFQTERDVERFERYAAEEELDVGQTRVRAFPIGIDYEMYAEAPEQPAARKKLAEIERRYPGKQVVFSVSRLDYTKGILEQLAAVDALLKARPQRDWVYKLVVAPSREDLDEYQAVKRQAAALAAEINRRHGTADWQPVEYEYRGFDLDELAAWYRRADVMLVTPLIDGMNLIAKEYVAAHDGGGVLVLGREAGAAQQMTEALLVDPKQAEATAATIGRALDMPGEERRRRMRALRDGVRRDDVRGWADSFLQALEPQTKTSGRVGGVR
jgi:trehalose-6-phosphate synthase